jgi:hypothetical protein
MSRQILKITTLLDTYFFYYVSKYNIYPSKVMNEKDHNDLLPHFQNKCIYALHGVNKF